MAAETELSFADRHHRIRAEKVGEGVFAVPSAAVAVAFERMTKDEEERKAARSALAEEIRAWIRTARSEYVNSQKGFSRHCAPLSRRLAAD